MNLLTRTGLLPSILVRNVQPEDQDLEKDITFTDIVMPAPFGFRPFSQYYNPYANGCSILCNHPVDQETKRSIKKAKEILERKCAIAHNDHFNSDEHIDDIFVPEVLFRRYTETDSRPQTPTPTVTSVTSKLSLPRRCITPDPCLTTSCPEKTQLILDLRRSLSQNAMDNPNSGRNNDGRALPTGSLAMPVAISFTFSGNDREADLKAKGHGTKFVQQDQPFSKKARKSNDGSATDKGGSSDLSIAKGLTKDKEPKSSPQKKKKKKAKMKNVKRSTDNEFKDLTEPDETQMSNCNERCATDQTSEDSLANPNESTAADESVTDPYPLDEEVVKQLQRELNPEILDNEFDPKRRKVLEEVYAKASVMRRSSAVNDEIKLLKHEMRLNSIITGSESLFNLPRTFSRRNARFELPINRRSLCEMKPLDYLKVHVYITNESHFVYNEVFKINLDPEFAELRFLTAKKIMPALAQVMGRDFTSDECSMFSSLLELENNAHIDFRTWCGICALCERILGEHFAQKYLSKTEDPYHEVEYVDFSCLEKKLYNLRINDSLMKILYKIKEC